MQEEGRGGKNEEQNKIVISFLHSAQFLIIGEIILV
jgi:hypothetical protein